MHCSTHGCWLAKREPPAGLQHCLFLPMVSSYLRVRFETPFAFGVAGRSRTYPPRASAVRRWKLSMPWAAGTADYLYGDTMRSVTCWRHASGRLAVTPRLSLNCSPSLEKYFLRQTTTTDQQAHLDLKANGFGGGGGGGGGVRGSIFWCQGVQPVCVLILLPANSHRFRETREGEARPLRRTRPRSR